MRELDIDLRERNAGQGDAELKNQIEIYDPSYHIRYLNRHTYS